MARILTLEDKRLLKRGAAMTFLLWLAVQVVYTSGTMLPALDARPEPRDIVLLYGGVTAISFLFSAMLGAASVFLPETLFPRPIWIWVALFSLILGVVAFGTVVGALSRVLTMQQAAEFAILLLLLATLNSAIGYYLIRAGFRELSRVLAQ